ncbi:class I SAM-dependent methyltransferase [Candidatus Parcubacteria bacterium]|nr:class I SAM-dependent methyltransferase [Candidatus Parcubacteria bacterium]
MAQNEHRFSNKVGEEYDLFSLALPHQDEIQIRAVEKIVKHFPNKENIKVLEIGFGTGITTNEILSQSEHVSLIGIDNEPGMLNRAVTKLEYFSPERFQLYIADALEYLEKQDADTFDAVISVWVLHNLQADFRSKIYKEIYRVLKTNGIFVNGDKMAVTDIALHKEHLDWQLKQFDVYEDMGRSELKKEWTDHYIEDEDSSRILYESTFIQDLQKLGFKDCVVDNRHYMDAIGSAIKVK